MNTKYYKKYIEKLISTNPAEIKIIRKEEIDDGYGGSIIDDVEISETVTFYERNARREVVTDYGTTYTGTQVTKILAKCDADIKEGDVFQYKGKTFRVVFVENYFDICKQIELEMVQ